MLPSARSAAALEEGLLRRQPLRPSRRLRLGLALAVTAIVMCTAVALATASRAPARRPVALAPPAVPAPYVYVTFHGTHKLDGKPGSGINQIYRYPLAGNASLAGAAPLHVLRRARAEPTRELRGMLLDEPTGHLFVANAFSGDSKILRFGACAADGSRPFIERVFPWIGSSLLVHPYGLAIQSGSLYATTQDTGSIVGVRLRGGAERLGGAESAREAAAAPEEGRAVERSIAFGGAGARVAFRGLASFEGCLFAAEEGSDAVFRLCNGALTATIPIRKPIGLVVDPIRRLLFVGSREARGARVVALDLDSPSFSEVQRFTRPQMTHPAGLALDGDRLYVAEQDARQLLEFDIPSGKLNRVVVDGLPDAPEWIVLSRC